MPPDPFDLQRFLDAQDAATPGGRSVHDQALAELRAGRKTSHWMWFVFPQVAGLGQSPISRRYAVRGVDEARAYLAHPVLGPRLREAAELAAAAPAHDVTALLGAVDALKLRSSMTLFLRADPGGPWQAVLDRWYGGRTDPATDERLG